MLGWCSLPFIILIITITTTPNGYVYNQYRNYLSRTLFKFSYTILHELCVLWGYKEVSHPPKLTEVEKEKWKLTMSNSATPRTVTHQAPLSMKFSRQGYWSGLPFPSPGDLPDPGIEPISPALTADSLLLIHPGSPCSVLLWKIIIFLWTFCVLFQIKMWNAHLFTLPPCPHKSKW